MLTRLKELVIPRSPRGTRRSKAWPAARRQHLREHPVCLACGNYRELEVHHVIPFHQAPELELVPSNLVTLCESRRFGVNCHLFFGHKGDYRSKFNPDVRKDAAYLGRLLREFP